MGFEILAEVPGVPALKPFGQFMAQCLREFRQTGAVSPSSRFLARAMMRDVPPDRPIRALEVGGGAGALTGTLLTRVADGSHVDIVEINPVLAEILEGRVKDWVSPSVRRVHARVLCTDIREFRPEAPYDFVLCSLPFNNFPASLVDELIGAMLATMAPTGAFTFFEYLYLRAILKHGISRRAEQLRAVDQVVRRYKRENFVWEERILRNFPPALVIHLRPGRHVHADRRLVSA